MGTQPNWQWPIYHLIMQHNDARHPWVKKNNMDLDTLMTGAEGKKM